MSAPLLPFRQRPVPNPLSAGPVQPFARSMPVADNALPGQAAPCESSFAAALLTQGVVPGHTLLAALAQQKRHGGRLSDLLVTQGLCDEGAVRAALARHWGIAQANPATLPADPALIDRYGAARALRNHVLPWRRAGGRTLVIVGHPLDFARRRAGLERCFGPVTPLLAPPAAIEAALLASHGARLARAAELSVAEADSSRTWGPGAAAGGGPRWPAFAAALAVVLLWLVPQAVAIALALWAVVTLALTITLKAAAALSALRRQPAPPAPAPVIARLPVVSVMVALYREASIAPRLIRRLERIDYPRDLLDVVLVVEAEDRLTRDALARAGLPPWMRVVPVPPGRVKTKPRALNYALGLCRGSIIGVYDAEDAPAPDQIARVVQRFHEAPPEVVCLQGVLDFYNPRANWLARCFTMEYAAWFRVILPGLARLRLPVPLGGTTLFFRRDVLEDLGAWDAWNVTEDADLGIRLTRHGYRTELIDTVTEEEANCRAWPWVKQRSRWIKGYMMTWAVHMRRPRALWHDLGPRGFLGFQVLFLGTLSQFVLAPVLWSFWLVPLGVPHPVADALPGPLATGLMLLFLLTEVVNLTVGWLGLRQTRHGMSPLWLVTLHAYFPLGALASYKAGWEMVVKPFYWDKTAHGLSEGPTAAAPFTAGDQPPATRDQARAAALAQARLLHPLLLPDPAAPRPKPPPLLRRRQGARIAAE